MEAALHDVANMILFFDELRKFSKNDIASFVTQNWTKLDLCQSEGNMIQMINLIRKLQKESSLFMNAYKDFIIRQYTKYLKVQCAICSYQHKDFFTYDKNELIYNIKLNVNEIIKLVDEMSGLARFEILYKFSMLMDCVYNGRLSESLNDLHFTIPQIYYSQYILKRNPHSAFDEKKFKKYMKNHYFFYNTRLIYWGNLYKIINILRFNKEKHQDEIISNGFVQPLNSMFYLNQGNLQVYQYSPYSIHFEIVDDVGQGYETASIQIDPDLKMYKKIIHPLLQLNYSSGALFLPSVLIFLLY